MKSFNLITEPRPPLKNCKETRCKKLDIEDKAIFLDPGTLSCFEEENSTTPPQTSGKECEFHPANHIHPKGVVLALTRNCNLKCSYCYVQREHSNSKTMSIKTALRAVKLLDKRGRRSIGFFGGEPTLAWDIIQAVIKYIKKQTASFKRGISYSLTTNATLITKKRAEFLALNNFSLIVSLDGPKNLHNKERITKDGTGSFDDVMRGLKYLHDAGLSQRITLRATYPLGSPMLVQRLEFLNNLVEQKMAGNVSVEPAWPDKTQTIEPNYSAIEAEYIRAAKWAEKRLTNNKPLYFHHFKTYLTRILLRRPSGSECGAGFGYLQVSPDGTINACHKEQGGSLGSLKNGISELARTKWRENRYYARTGCSECWARNICGGGCRALSSEYCGDIKAPWDVECKIRLIQIKSAIYLASNLDSETLAHSFAPRKKIKFARRKPNENPARS